MITNYISGAKNNAFRARVWECYPERSLFQVELFDVQQIHQYSLTDTCNVNKLLDTVKHIAKGESVLSIEAYVEQLLAADKITERNGSPQPANWVHS